MMNEEDEAFEQIEKNQHYKNGWNAALDLAAFQLIHAHKKAFGEDTLASIAAYIKGMKK